MEHLDLRRIVEFVVIGGYLVALIGVAAVFRRFNRNISDYFRSGCRATWWLVGASAFMTAFSAWTFTAAAGVAFESGWSVVIIYLGNAYGYLLNAAFLAPWFRQLRAISPPEVVKMRFGVTTQQFYAWISFLTQVLYSGMHLYGLSIFAAAVFGLEVRAIIIVVGLVVLLYSAVGGSWAVMATDFIQGLILLPMTVLVAALCLVRLGGVGEMFRLIDARPLAVPFKMINARGEIPGDYDYTIAWAVAMFLKNSLGYNTLTAAPRYFAVKDGRDARRAALLAMGMMTLGAAIWFIPPITARLLFEGQVSAVPIGKPAEAAYAVASINLLPAGLTGLMVVAMFAATMSSMDTDLNRNAAIFTNDIYPALCRLFRRRHAHGRRLLLLGQLYSLALGLVIIAVACYFSILKGAGVFKIMMDVGTVIALPLMMPMLMGLFIKPAPWWSAIFSVAVTAVPASMGFLSGGRLFKALAPAFVDVPWLHNLLVEPWKWQNQVFANMAVGAAAFLVTIPFWLTATAGYRRQVRAFFHRMRTPVDFAREVGQASDLSQLKLVGGFTAAIGGCICLLLLLPNPAWGRASILFVGGTILATGGAMAWLGLRAGRE